jgi:hypothetical protein
MFRLDRLERYALAKAFEHIPRHAKSNLFGSRLQLDARGGDIDILIELDASPAERFELSSHISLVFKEHCDERIDVVVLPMTHPSSNEKAFRDNVQKVMDLRTIVHAPLLDHLALVVRDLDASLHKSMSLGFEIQKAQPFEDTKCRECYVGEPKRPARLLFMQPTAPGSYQRTLDKRGPGLHHLGLVVPCVPSFLDALGGSGWFIHPSSLGRIQLRDKGPIYLVRPGAPLVEVNESEPTKPAPLAPVVEGVRVSLDESLTERLSCLGVPELMWASIPETELRINGTWRRVSELAI